MKIKNVVVSVIASGLVLSAIAFLVNSQSRQGTRVEASRELAPEGLVAYAASYSSDPEDEPKFSTQNTKTFQYLNLGNTLDSYRGDSVKVGIIDSGINYDHEDFMVNNATKVKGDSKYFEYQTSSWVYYKASQHGYSYINDTHGHGTNVAATVAAAINSVGGTGLAPNVELYVYKVTNSSNGYEFGAIQNALLDAKTLGLDVINMSFQSYEHEVEYGNSKMPASTGCSTILSYYLNQAYNAGITLVGAAGNYNTTEPSYPGSNSHVINVGSLSDDGTTKAPFSNYGSTIDLVAPGYVHVADDASNTAYTNTSGTSFSAPLVTAAIALYIQKYPSATPSQIESALYAACDPIESGSTYSNWAGNGSLNVARFLGVEEDTPTVSSVTVSPSSLSLDLNGTKTGTLSATVNGTHNPSQNVTWESSNASVATVSSSGVVTAEAVGTATITATSVLDPTKSGEATVTVTNTTPTVTSVTLNKSSLSLNVNGSETLTATVNGTYSPSQSVTWTSSDEDIATVSSGGLVTAKAVGTATITATSVADNTKSAGCTVTVSAAPSGTGMYSLVTSPDDLSSGSSYLITNGTSGSVKAMAVTSNTNNRKSTSLTVSNGQVTRGNDALSVTLGGSTGAWTFHTENYAGTAGYFNATSTTSSNNLSIESTLNKYAYFSITFGSSNAVITCTGKSTRNIIMYNSGSDIFSCYTSGQNQVYLWKEITASTKTLSSISISGYTTSFVEGDTFLFGGTVTAYYSDSTNANVTAQATFEGYNMTNVSNQTVTVSYSYQETTKTASYDITVGLGTLSSIAVSGQTTSYQKNQGFSFDGTCTATFVNGYQKSVTPTSVTSPDMSTAGVKTITVSFTYNGSTKTTTYDITVASSRTVIEAVTTSIDSTITWPSSATPSISGDLHNVSATTSGNTVYESSSIRLGTGSGGGTLNISATESINKVDVEAKYYSASYSSAVLKVDGQSITPLTSDYKTYTVTLETAKPSFAVLTQDKNSRINIKSIKLYSTTTVETDISTSADCVGLESFIDVNMHMDYVENLGYCKDSEHHYYSTAKVAFNLLNDHQRSLFTSNVAYANEWNRLSTWASFNGDALDEDNYLVKNSKVEPLSVDTNDDYLLMVVSIISIMSSVSIIACLVIKSKKRKFR